MAGRQAERKYAFTLAETLITLVIIGIVAAVILPIISQNIWEKTKTERIRNIKQKLSKSTDEMLATSGLNGYTSTEDFLNIFRKHMKITQICKPEEIQKCWGSKEVTLKNGNKWDISKTLTPRELIIPTREDNKYTDIMGIVTADGTPLIISYNTNCNITLKDGRIWSNEKSSSLSCLSGVFDWNGGKTPNKLGEDVLNFNFSSGLGDGCAVDVNGKCFTSVQVTSENITFDECEKIKNQYGVKQCCTDFRCNVNGGDKFTAAAKACGGVKNLASVDDLLAMAKELYGQDIGTTTNYSGKRNESVAKKYGLPANAIMISGVEYSSNGIYTRSFNSNQSTYGAAYNRSGGAQYFICKSN